jgi:hypothetical protein
MTAICAVHNESQGRSIALQQNSARGFGAIADKIKKRKLFQIIALCY